MNPTEYPVQCDAPYPEIAVTCQNVRYASMLQQNLAGAKSEATATHTYLYQSWVIAGKNPGLSKQLHRVALVEMRHFEILGKLILLLGGDPRLLTCRHNRIFFWNGSMPAYSRSIPFLLRGNIDGERHAMETYRRQACSIQDEKVSAILRRLADDEELHLKCFEDFLAQCSAALQQKI